jgi:hypothetical protein
MDLTNKTIDVEGLAVNTQANETTAQVVLLTELAPGVFQKSDSYSLTFNDSFFSTDDPDLMAEIVQVLEQLP